VARSIFDCRQLLHFFQFAIQTFLLPSCSRSCADQDNVVLAVSDYFAQDVGFIRFFFVPLSLRFLL
jgi:hypothetical protein